MVLYRYQLAYDYADVATLKLHEYSVVRESEASYWIQLNDWNPALQKVVRKNARKTFAYDTQKKALNNYIKRTTKRVQYLQRDLSNARSGLIHAEALYSHLFT
jgi:hypothetical protein